MGMRQIFHLSFSYMKFYKKQTAALLAGILLSAALVSGIGSLLASGRHATMEKARLEYGDWHYSLRGDAVWTKQFLASPQGEGYRLVQYGMETVRRIIETPCEIMFVYGDDAYLEMMGRTLTEGHYPEEEQEIAMDRYTLVNLGFSEKLGTEVTLDGETFILCGILTEQPEKFSDLQGDIMQVFVNETLDYGTNGKFLYLKFDENRSVYRQLQAFRRQFAIGEAEGYRNNGLAEYVGSYPVSLFSVLKDGFSSPALGLPYVWGMLNAGGVLTERAVLLALAVFGAFAIYSLFQVSVRKRLAQYSVMQTVGMTDGAAFGLLFLELCLVFFAGYPLGALLGNAVGMGIYKRIGRVFVTLDEVYHTGAGEQSQTLSVTNLPDPGSFQVNWGAVWGGAVFFLAVLLVISMLLMRRMKQRTLRQMMGQDAGKAPGRRKIYSLRRENMTSVLTKKFMFSRKGMLVGILLSLSVGSVIFLGASYVTENAERNNELIFKADDGLGSDIKIYEASDRLSDVIPGETLEKIRAVDGLQEVHPVQYLMGEVALENGILLAPQYFAELADDEADPPDPEMMEKYGGVAVRTGEDDYAVKVNLYGYDDEMLEELNTYLLEGSIDPEQMRRENTVILKQLMDGQGNYDQVALFAGDTIRIRTVKNRSVPQEALRFQGDASWYREQDVKLAAVVTRPLARVDTFLKNDGTNTLDIIMTNEQMEELFGVSGYQTVSISLEEKADSEAVTEKLCRVTGDVEKCIVEDYTLQIEAQNLYLGQKMMFFYGIADVLFGVSILHIMNSMQYLVTARKHEFGILRAMGITDAGFCRMLAKEGLRYGIYSSLVILVLYAVVQRVLYYFMVHVYLYLHPNFRISGVFLLAVIALNLAICVAAVLLSGRQILKEDIVREIQ